MFDPFAFLDGPAPQSAVIDSTQAVRFTVWARADRKKRQIIEAIELHEDCTTLEEYLIAEDPMIDAITLFDQAMADDIKAAYDDHLAMLRGYETTRDIPKDTGSRVHAYDRPTKGNEMANPDFKKFVFKNVTFAWPRLDQPYRYNSQTEKSEPCAANVQGAGYSIAWEMPYDKAKELHAEMAAHYADCQTRNTKLPAFSTVFGLKRLKDASGNDTDTAQFTAKKNAVKKDGELAKPPTVVDTSHAELQDKAIWGGSTGHVRVLAFPATNPQDKSGGVSLLLDAVVVTDAVYGGDGLEDDFGEPEASDDLDDLPIGDQPMTTPTAAQSASGATAGGF